MKRKFFKLLKLLFHYGVLGLFSLLCAYPFLWTLSAAFSTSGDVFAFPPRLIPSDPSFKNFIAVFESIEMGRFYFNSIWISFWTVFWVTLICALAAYPVAMMEFKGKKFVFGLIMLTLILPSEVNFLVNFVTVNRLELSDTHLAVILPNIATAISFLILKNSMETIPKSILEAAKIDGAGELVMLFKIILPIILPAIAALTIFTVVNIWNAFIWPAVVLTDTSKYPLSVGVLYLSGTFSSSTRVVAAGTVLAILPILIVFLLTQKSFTRGMEGAIK